jgi:hypothetical protein
MKEWTVFWYATSKALTISGDIENVFTKMEM